MRRTVPQTIQNLFRPLAWRKSCNLQCRDNSHVCSHYPSHVDPSDASRLLPSLLSFRRRRPRKSTAFSLLLSVASRKRLTGSGESATTCQKEGNAHLLSSHSHFHIKSGEALVCQKYLLELIIIQCTRRLDKQSIRVIFAGCHRWVRIEAEHERKMWLVRYLTADSLTYSHSMSQKQPTCNSLWHIFGVSTRTLWRAWHVCTMLGINVNQIERETGQAEFWPYIPYRATWSVSAFVCETDMRIRAVWLLWCVCMYVCECPVERKCTRSDSSKMMINQHHITSPTHGRWTESNNRVVDHTLPQDGTPELDERTALRAVQNQRNNTLGHNSKEECGHGLPTQRRSLRDQRPRSFRIRWFAIGCSVEIPADDKQEEAVPVVPQDMSSGQPGLPLQHMRGTCTSVPPRKSKRVDALSTFPLSPQVHHHTGFSDYSVNNCWFRLKGNQSSTTPLHHTNTDNSYVGGRSRGFYMSRKETRRQHTYVSALFLLVAFPWTQDKRSSCSAREKLLLPLPFSLTLVAKEKGQKILELLLLDTVRCYLFCGTKQNGNAFVVAVGTFLEQPVAEKQLLSQFSFPLCLCLSRSLALSLCNYAPCSTSICTPVVLSQSTPIFIFMEQSSFSS